jgi:hypothetical protein
MSAEARYVRAFCYASPALPGRFRETDVTDEQFEKMYAVELTKLALLQGIMNNLMTIASKDGGRPSLYNWDDLSKMLAGAIKSSEPRPRPAARTT